MRSVKWLRVGFAIGVLLPMLAISEVRAQNWCADEAKVRERLERAIEDSGEIEIIARCKLLAIPGLLAALEERIVHDRAALALISIGEENRDAIPLLIAALKNKSTDIRRGIIRVFSVMGVNGKNKDTILVLIAGIENENSEVRQGVAEVLGRMHQDARAVVPALNKALKDENPEVRWAANAALRNLSRTPEKNVSLLTAILKDENAEIRERAVQEFGRFNMDGKNPVLARNEALNEALKAAASALIVVLKDENPKIRHRAAAALGRIGGQNKDAPPALIEALKDESMGVRLQAAEALALIGGQNKDVPPALIEALKDESLRVRLQAAEALALIGGQNKDVPPALIEALKDEEPEMRKLAAEVLGRIATAFYEAADNAEQLDRAQKNITTIHRSLKETEFEEPKQQVERLLSALQGQQSQIRLDKRLTWYRNILLSHLLVWVLLIFAYPRSTKIQALFFWNPWIRRILGLWYVGLLLTWVPFLRAKLFAPFKETLLADAELDCFDTQGYFEGSIVLIKTLNQIQSLQDAIPKVKGQIVLEGESGLGKSMFLRSLVRKSSRILVYLRAVRCTGGVMEAIQAKLHGPAKDPKFLRDLIYSGTIDIFIDGLNEVNVDTRAKITSFVESYFKGNIIMTTQRLEWTPPAMAKTYVLQPLKHSQIEAFLTSRSSSELTLANGSDYQQACRDYLRQVLDSRHPPEVLQSVQRILSNPMDLTLVAQMLAAGKTPNLSSLQQQQYGLMAEDYKELYLGLSFPLTQFSEHVYQLRLNDEASLAESVFPKELRCMGRHKMMLSRQSLDAEGKPVNHWYFRHDKVMDFFIAQTFLNQDDGRLLDHIGDLRFRGVYFLLATQMSFDDAMELREVLIEYAAENQDHNVFDVFVQLLQERRNARAAIEKATATVSETYSGTYAGT